MFARYAQSDMAKKNVPHKPAVTPAGGPSGVPRPPRPEPTPPKAVAAPARLAPSLYDDEDDDITLVAVMTEEVKALRKGYRHAGAPKAPTQDGPSIVVDSEEEVDALLVEELLDDWEDDVEHAPRIGVVSFGATDIGRRRKINEDELLLLSEQQTYLVADGMGGHNAGEIASKLAVRVIERALRTGRFEGEPNVFWPRKGDELARAIEAANRAVFAQACSDARYQGMGTTVTALRLSTQRQRAYIAHVGDSPCLRLRGKRLEQLTVDHTFAALLGVEGPMGEHLTRGVGIEETVEVDLQVDIPEIGDRYILASDGLTKMVPLKDILRILRRERRIEDQAQGLIDEANARGGRDNISVVIVAIVDPR
ncbi:MAG: protein phosphatase 2C domain-containing protein [Polyangiaceae bacterium]